MYIHVISKIQSIHLCAKNLIPSPPNNFEKKKHVPLSAKNPQTIPNFQSAPVHGPVAPSSFSLMSSAFELIRWGPKAGLVPCNVPWWDLVVSPPGFRVWETWDQVLPCIRVFVAGPPLPTLLQQKHVPRPPCSSHHYRPSSATCGRYVRSCPR